MDGEVGWPENRGKEQRKGRRAKVRGTNGRDERASGKNEIGRSGLEVGGSGRFC